MKRLNQAVAEKPAWHRGSVATLVALLAATPQAWAMSLGRLNVQSALGESLRAEIDVTSITPEEATDLAIKVATPEAYRAAGVEYNTVLPGTKVSLHRRADGRPYLKMTSDKAVQEPFLDVILEMNWSTGRLVREYTLLFDPPSTAKAAPAAEESVRNGAAMTSAQPSGTPSPSAETASAVPPAAPPQKMAAAASAPTKKSARKTTAEPNESSGAAPVPAMAGNGGTIEVRSGDTLTKVAARLSQQGISLDQMVVGLFRANPAAFMGNNMNRLRAGATLSVPDAAQAQATSTPDARQFIRAQSADFNQYRRTLAAAASPQATPAEDQKASGKVQAQVDERDKASAGAPDKLTLSKGTTADKAANAGEQKIADERAQRDASTRVAELSRNLNDLNKLKGEAGAATSGGSASSGDKGQVPIAVNPPPAPAPQPAPPAPASAPPAPEPSPPTVPPVVAEPVGLASEPVAASAASAPAAATTPASDEPSLLAKLLNSNWVLPGAAALVALLAGLGLYRMRNRRGGDGGETSFLESRLQQDSFFGASGGQRVDTHDGSGAPSSMSYSLSQLDAIGDVDPVAEADVYLAYGRDLQAEEILKEAMRANPERLAIRTKLLEVYAKRRDTKGFEVLATQLYNMTQGQGEDWLKAQGLGLSIDAENPLYQPGGKPATATPASPSAAAGLGATTMAQSGFQSSRRDDSTSGAMSTSPGGLDLDLDLDPTKAAPTTRRDNLPGASGGDSLRLDLPSAPGDFTAASPAIPAAPPNFDFSGFSLELDGKGKSKAAAPTTGRGGLDEISRFDFLESAADEASTDPLARKMELAEEFIQIGDVEGARDLLKEVVSQASGTLKAKAQSMLENVS